MNSPTLIVTVMTILFLFILIFASWSLQTEISRYEEGPPMPLPPMCSPFPPDPKNISCWDYLSTCQAKYFADVVQTKNPDDARKRAFVLQRAKLATMPNGQSLGSCTIPYTDFRMFELTEQCADGSKFHSKDVGCMTPFKAQNVRKEDAIKGVHVAGPGLKKTVRTDALMDGVREAFKRMEEGAVAPRDMIFPTMHYRPNLPNRENLPELAGIMGEYENFYNQKFAAFRTSNTRCGYVMGKVYITPDMKPIKNGKIDTMPLIQKKFGDRYYSMLYRYTQDAYKNLECNNLSEWFFNDPDYEKPVQRMELMTDPNTTYQQLDEFLKHKTMQYRNQYMVDVIKNNKSRFYIIIEVGNQTAKDPIFTLQLCKYGIDMGKKKEIDLMKFFGKGRIMDEFTSNKQLINEQFNVSTFNIDCGTEHAWTIGYTQPNGVNCQNHNVFMTIPTGKTCPWQGWFRGGIIVSNGAPINLASPIDNYDEFRKNNLGQWMTLWVCAENGDPFQEIQMLPGISNFNPYAFYGVFKRKEGQTDESWALFIWKTISGDGDAAKYNETFQKLADKVKGKNILDFQDYLMVCDSALSNQTFIKTAMNSGCIVPGPPKKPLSV